MLSKHHRSTRLDAKEFAQALGQRISSFQDVQFPARVLGEIHAIFWAFELKDV